MRLLTAIEYGLARQDLPVSRQRMPTRVDVDPLFMTGREACEALATRGVLAKETHGATLRIAPPLVIEAEDID